MVPGHASSVSDALATQQKRSAAASSTLPTFSTEAKKNRTVEMPGRVPPVQHKSAQGELGFVTIPSLGLAKMFR